MQFADESRTNLRVWCIFTLRFQQASVTKRRAKRGRYRAWWVDECAVGTFIQESNELVGHVPIELSFLVFTFIRSRQGNHVVAEVKGGRRLQLAGWPPVIPGPMHSVSHGYFPRGNEKETCTTLKVFKEHLYCCAIFINNIRTVKSHTN